MKTLQVLAIAVVLLASGCATYAGYDEWTLGAREARDSELPMYQRIASEYPELVTFGGEGDARFLRRLDTGDHGAVSDGAYRYSALAGREFERVELSVGGNPDALAICLRAYESPAGFVELYATERLTVALHNGEGGAGSGLHLVEFVQDGRGTVLRVDGTELAREVHDLWGLTVYVFQGGTAEIDWIAWRIE